MCKLDNSKEKMGLSLQNDQGLIANFTHFGAALTAMYVPDKNGSLSNIAYYNPLAFGGAIIAPVAGRVRKGEVKIGDRLYKMPCGESDICLHSGADGTGKAFWQVQEYTETKIVFKTHLQSGKCGLPGNRSIKAEYTLGNNSLSLAIDIDTDCDTFVNPTSHIYWNLSGDFSNRANGHSLRLPSKEVYYNNEQHLPQKLCPTKNTPFDFNTPTMWESDLSENQQIKCAKGYNHAFVLDENDVIKLAHNESGRTLSVTTNASHVVFYSGEFLPVQGCAVAFEPQMLPDAPFMLGNQLPILKARQAYHWATKFEFGILE